MDTGLQDKGPPLPKDKGILEDEGAPKDSAPQDKATPKDSAPQDKAVPKDQTAPDKTPPKQDQGTPWKSWITVFKGGFDMGSPASELCREPSTAKETHHLVTLSHGFKMQATEVTQGQFLAQMGYNPSNHAFCGKTCPVEMVTWHEAAAYCNKLSQNAGLTQCYVKGGSGSFCTKDGDCLVTTEACVANACTGYEVSATYAGPITTIYGCPGYRLPTEAEWEYAYRAKTTTAFYNGGIGNCTVDAKAGAIGWYADNAGGKTHEVGLKTPNGWGLHDMAGNVWEWVHDGYVADLGATAASDPVHAPTGASRVVRGGSWSRPAGDLRAAHRFSYNPRKRGGNRGFRCVKSL
jgi:formylglycine-generating enzyme required for sulfatase activity